MHEYVCVPHVRLVPEEGIRFSGLELHVAGGNQTWVLYRRNKCS